MYVGSWYCGKWGKFNGENKWFKDGPPAQHPLHLDLSKTEQEKKTKKTKKERSRIERINGSKMDHLASIFATWIFLK